VQNGVAFTPNATQTYTVTGTDANGCTNTAQVQVAVNALPVVSAGANQTICSGANVTLNGSGATSYAWNNNVQDGVAFTPNATQTYTVTGTDANGCTNTAQVQVAVNALPIVSAGSNQAVCTGTAVTLSGSGASTYAWNNNVQDGVAFTPNATQTYTVIGTDANGCTNTAQVQVAVNALPVVSAGANQTICSGANVTLNGSGATSYAWNNNVQDGVAFTPNATQTYTVTGTDVNGCTNTAQVQVAVNALPIVSAGSNQAVCTGTAVTLSGSGASTYAWNNNVQDGVAFTPNATQTYTVTGTDVNGCTNTAQVQVAVNALPVVSAGSNQAVCTGTAVTLSGSGASTYAWNNNVQNGVAFTPNATQTYTVTGTDANGCTNTAQVQVAVNALPVVSAGQSFAVCQGTSVILFGSGAQSYTWNNGVVNSTPFVPILTQSYTLVGTDINGCSNTAQVTVTVNPLPIVSGGGNQNVCAGNSVTLSGSGANNYTWNNNVQNGVAFTPNATQTYTVTGTDANGCTNTAQVQVVVNALPVVTAGSNQTVCSGSSVTLSGSGASTYAWNNNIQNGTSFTPNATQTYTVTGTDANGCSNTAQVLVTVNPLPQLVLGNNINTCVGSPVTLSATGAVTYNWSGGVQNGVSFVPNTTQYYVVTGVNGLGCSTTDSILVSVHNPTSSTINITACNSYSLNGDTFNQSGTYIQTIQNVMGCDSTITLNLVINVPPLLPIITVNNDVTLTTLTQPNVTYQWVFCNTWLPINNQTDTSFTSTINGQFAVIVSNGCGSVTSECVTIDNVNLTDLTNNELSIYPNPTSDIITIEGLSDVETSFYLMDTRGRIVKNGYLNSSAPQLSLFNLSTGIYWLHIIGNKPIELIKQ
jgi:predicted ribosome-associated RNA-binding protein Tma20